MPTSSSRRIQPITAACSRRSRSKPDEVDRRSSQEDPVRCVLDVEGLDRQARAQAPERRRRTPREAPRYVVRADQDRTRHTAEANQAAREADGVGGRHGRVPREPVDASPRLGPALPAAPTAQDRAMFQAILARVSSAPAKTTPTQLSKRLDGVFPGNKNERDVVI